MTLRPRASPSLHKSPGSTVSPSRTVSPPPRIETLERLTNHNLHQRLIHSHPCQRYHQPNLPPSRPITTQVNRSTISTPSIPHPSSTSNDWSSNRHLSRSGRTTDRPPRTKASSRSSPSSFVRRRRRSRSTTATSLPTARAPRPHRTTQPPPAHVYHHHSRLLRRRSIRIASNGESFVTAPVRYAPAYLPRIPNDDRTPLTSLEYLTFTPSPLAYKVIADY